MRSELHETGVGLRAAKAPVGVPAEALEPSAVDAALGDDSTPILEPPSARRELRPSAADNAARRTIDQPHDGALLRQLSRQLSLLEIQQQQIRRLLEETERRGGRAAEAR